VSLTTPPRVRRAAGCQLFISTQPEPVREFEVEGSATTFFETWKKAAAGPRFAVSPREREPLSGKFKRGRLRGNCTSITLRAHSLERRASFTTDTTSISPLEPKIDELVHQAVLRAASMPRDESKRASRTSRKRASRMPSRHRAKFSNSRNDERTFQNRRTYLLTARPMKPPKTNPVAPDRERQPCCQLVACARPPDKRLGAAPNGSPSHAHPRTARLA